MDVHLSEESRRFLADQVAAGRYPTEEAVLEDALSLMRRTERVPRRSQPVENPGLGMFSDAPQLFDEVVEEAMRIREERPCRLPAGG